MFFSCMLRHMHAHKQIIANIEVDEYSFKLEFAQTHTCMIQNPNDISDM